METRLNNMHGLLASMLENDDSIEQLLNNIEQYKYLVCIDMGCGGICAMAYRVHGNFLDTQRIVWTDGNLVEPTVIGYKDEKPILGSKAFKYGNAAENFKTLPDEDELAKDNVLLELYGKNGKKYYRNLFEIWGDCFSEIIDNCLKTTGYNDICKDNTLFVIGHPASDEWKEALQAYRALIIDKTHLKPEQIITISEAKAVMQYVTSDPYREKRYENVKFNNGVMFVDIGASTIDISYVADKVYDKPEKRLASRREFSLEMAGRDVDCILANYVFDKCRDNLIGPIPKFGKRKNNESFFQTNRKFFRGAQSSKVMYMIRLKKERICDNDKDDFLCEGIVNKDIKDLLENSLIEVECSDNEFFEYCKDKKLVSEAALKGSWYRLFRHFVAFAIGKYHVDGGLSIGSVVVTGGSARLIGIREQVKLALKKALGHGNADAINLICLDTMMDYCSTVPFGGIYYVGRILNNIKTILGFPREVLDVFNTELTDILAKNIAIRIAKICNDTIQQALDVWASYSDEMGTALRSLKQFKTLLTNKVKDNITQKVIQSQIELVKNNDIKTESFANTEETISKFLKKISGQESLEMEYKINNVKLTQIKPSSIAKNIMAEVQNITKKLSFTQVLGRAGRQIKKGVGKIFKNSWQYTDTNPETIPWSQKERQRLRDTSNETVSVDSVFNLIKAEIESQIAEQSVNTVNVIIEELEDYISSALCFHNSDVVSE